jgi:hypothetical protein
VLSIYSSQAGPEKNAYFLNKLNHAGSLEKYQLLQYYGFYLSRNVSNEDVLQKSLPVLYDLAEKDSHWYVRFEAMNSLILAQNALSEEKNSWSNTIQLQDLTEKIAEIKSKETDDRLRSLYGK